MKPYSEMTEEEAKAWFGYTFKRKDIDEEAYVCQVDIYERGTGYGVVSRDRDPANKYDINELKQYLTDYPEMEVPGWIGEPDPKLVHLNEIRSQWVYWSPESLRAFLYKNLIYKYVDDDIWNAEDISRNLFEDSNKGLTCDEVSTLMSEYLGDNDVKYEELRLSRNAAKNYIRSVVDSFMKEHKEAPEYIEVPINWVQE